MEKKPDFWLYGKIRTLRTIQMGKGPQAFQASQDSPASPPPLRSEAEAIFDENRHILDRYIYG